MEAIEKVIINLEKGDVLYIDTPDGRSFDIYYENNKLCVDEVLNNESKKL